MYRLLLILCLASPGTFAASSYHCEESGKKGRTAAEFTVGDSGHVLFEGHGEAQDVTAYPGACQPGGRGGRIFVDYVGMYGTLLFRIPDSAASAAPTLKVPVTVHGVWGPKCDRLVIDCWIKNP